LHDIGFTAVAAPGSYRADGQPDDLPMPSTQRGAGREHDSRSTETCTTV